MSSTKKKSLKIPAAKTKQTYHKKMFPYLHGFSGDEQMRLRQQAEYAEFTIFRDINFSDVTNLLEVGCGVGAQSEIILRRFPKLQLTGIDLSPVQLAAAKKSLDKKDYAKSRFYYQQMNAQQMSFKGAEFDGAFLCWVLEHVPDPMRVLSELRRVLRPGSQIVINEVMNSSFFLEPYSPHVWQYWMSFNDYQTKIGGDPFIGMKLGNMLLSAGFRDIKTTVLTWHYDNREPQKRKQQIEFWADLLLSAADQLIQAKFIEPKIVALAKEELERVQNDPHAVFHYSFMQAQARVL